MMNSKLQKYLNTPTNSAPLVVFRLFFGIMMLASILMMVLVGYNLWVILPTYCSLFAD